MPSRPPIRPVIDRLYAEPYRFELIQALAILERLRPASARLGTGIDPELEAVQIVQDTTLTFPPSDISRLEAGDGGRPVLSTPVIGAAGLTGPLPYAFSESISERTVRRDHATTAFLGLFNHRLACIFYRIRRAPLPMLDGHPESSVMADALRAVVGIGMHSLSNRLEQVPDRTLMGFAAVLADRRGSGAALETLLGGVFRAPVRVRGFVGRWRTLPAEAQATLSAEAGPQTHRLGDGPVLGRAMWDQQAACTVSFTFADLERFKEFLPDGRHFREMVELCRFRLGTTVDVLLELILGPAAVPRLRLSATNGNRLGWTSWLTSRPASHPGRIRLDTGLTGD